MQQRAAPAIVAVAAVLAAAACDRGGAREPEAAAARESRPVAHAGVVPVPAAAPVAQPVHWAELEAAIREQADSADRQLRRVSGLTSEERARLRRDVNAVQVERARQLGITPGSDVRQLLASGRLVRLADTTDVWVLRELTYSEPFVTPATETMLLEIGRRFHAALDSLGVPRYRLDITSVLRTPEKQAALRRTNSNASRIDSAHEFGTTLDIAYRRFAAPADAVPPLGDEAQQAQARVFADSVLVETGRLRGAELQAVLGRVLRRMQDEGKLLVMMERRQTVYHITVGRRLPPQTGRAGAQ